MSEQQLSQQVSLRTALEARQLHSLEFLTAPLMELEQKISAELAANPV
ncbi:MAG: RNA polymerase sigma-54 factor, partial [Lentisphaeria bacterium]|nr:RNA polymerase sigma-54 factor [Lentisphaeria bacterium]